MFYALALQLSTHKKEMFFSIQKRKMNTKIPDSCLCAHTYPNTDDSDLKGVIFTL